MGAQGCRARIDVGKIASAPAGNEDLFAEPFVALDQEDRPAAPACLKSAHQSRRATADDDYIKIFVGQLFTVHTPYV